MLEYKLFNWQSENHTPLEVSHWNGNGELAEDLKDFKCFVEMQLFHLFSTKPLLHINNSGKL
jgi:hypothetical protein